MILGLGLGLPFQAANGDDDMAWTRPSDWTAMPMPTAEMIYILSAVTNDASNYVALSATVTGGFDVDWGDGDITSHASAAKAEHLYDYADAGLGALTTAGYKQALIKITPTSGGNQITAWDLGQKHSRTNLGAHVQPWLDIAINTPAATTIAIRSTVETRWVERINFIAIGAITSMSGLFQNCNSLQSVSFPTGSLASVTNMTNVFNSCVSLPEVTFPAGSLAAVTGLNSAFSTCSRMRRIAFPAGSLSLVTSATGTFSSCQTLKTISWPTGALAAVTTIANMFQNCLSLQEMSFPAGALAALTTLDTSFGVCTCLRKVTFPAGSLTLLTTLATCFSNCVSLEEVIFPSGALTLVVTTTNTFNACAALKRIQNCTIPVSFTIATQSFGGAQLDEIYTALPIAVAKTITITTNHGAVDDTPLIATAKGWTVTGT